jgi:hypothetical protein
MDEERKPWDQMIEEGENDLWYGRFVAFRRMGPKRSVNAVFKKENNKKQQKTTMVPGPTWYGAAKQWKWEERARAYYDHVTQEEDAVIGEEQKKVIRSGFALMHKRIRLLEKILAKLVKMQEQDDMVLLKETRTTTSTYGEDRSTEIVIEKVTFNAPLFMLIDKYLGSIAAEMGERVKKKPSDEEEGETEFTIRLVGKSPDQDEDE